MQKNRYEELKTDMKVLGITLVLIFIIIEVLLRFILASPSWPQKEAQRSENIILQYELKSNLDIIDKGPIIQLDPIRVKTNFNGLREDEEHPYEKPENTFRIALVGDSITFGMYVEQNQTFGHILETMLNKNSQDINYETLNFGVPGYNTMQEYEVIKEKVLQYDPDVVIITFVLNDLYEETSNPLTPLRNIGRHIYSLRLVYWNILKYSQRSENVTEPAYKDYFMTDFYLRKTNGILKEKNIIFIVVGPFCFKSYMCPSDPVSHFSNIAKDAGFHYSNLTNIFDNIENKDLMIPKEGHPNSLAHRILAEVIYNIMADKGIIAR